MTIDNGNYKMGKIFLQLGNFHKITLLKLRIFDVKFVKFISYYVYKI